MPKPIPVIPGVRLLWKYLLNAVSRSNSETTVSLGFGLPRQTKRPPVCESGLDDCRGLRDWLVERDGFEPSRPFISALQRAHERAEPKAARLTERLWAAACAILKSGASQFRISRIDPPPPRTLDLWISGTLAGQDVLPSQELRRRSRRL